jgi:hypothetical protein
VNGRGSEKRAQKTVCDRSGLSDVNPTGKIGPPDVTNETSKATLAMASVISQGEFNENT